jgi:predicted DNA-binding protein with PD1-like motif
MQQKQIHQSEGQRTFAVVLEPGEEVMDCLKRFVASEKIGAAQITAIGAFRDVVLMYFDWDKKDYTRIPVKEQVEVASLIGDVATGPTASPRCIFTWSSASATATPWRVILPRPMCGRPWK